MDTKLASENQASSLSDGETGCRTFTFSTSEIRSALQEAFDKITAEYGTENVRIKNLFKADGNPKSKADFSLYLSPCVYPVLCMKLDSVCEILKAELGDIFDDCRVSGDSRIQFFLNRSKTYRRVLKDIFCMSSAPSTNQKSVLVYVHGKRSQDLTTYRTLVISEHVVAVLIANGYRVYCDGDVLDDSCKFKYPDRVRRYTCESCDLDSEFSDWAELCENSCYKIDQNAINTVKSSKEIVVLDPTEYLKSKDIRSRPYHDSIMQITIKNDEFTDCFRQGSRLYHVLKEHANDVDIVFHVVPLQQRINAQKAGLLVEMVTNSKIDQLYLTSQIVVTKNAPQLTVTEYRNNICKGIELSLKHKYGTEVMNDDLWLSRLDMLTETVVKFDFLMTSFSSPLNIDSYSLETGFQDKGGTFVQYNCARLAVIFKRHRDGVKNGDYEDLPDVDEVDFSLLKLQEEWNLFSKYVLPYPDILNDLQLSIDCRDSVEVCTATHRISRMLVNLSRDLSLYYNKSRVLVEPCQRLFPKMNARLYLLKAVYHVLENGLSLLNLSPVEQM